MSKLTTLDALSILRPNSKFAYSNGEIIWQDETETQPTDSEINTKLTELQAEESVNDLRKVRNDKLAETDWEIVMHKEKGTNIPTALKTYRQALRDITDTYTSLDDVVWPEKP